MMARTLIRLWNLRLWVALGLLIAVAGGYGAMKAFHKEVYAAASTQLLVGSRRCRDQRLSHSDRRSQRRRSPIAGLCPAADKRQRS